MKFKQTKYTRGQYNKNERKNCPIHIALSAAEMMKLTEISESKQRNKSQIIRDALKLYYQQIN